MPKLVIEPSFWELFPACEIGVLALRGINNTEEGNSAARQDIVNLLEQANLEAKRFLTQPVLSQCPVVAVWRDAFSRFKKEKDARSSIEALLRRIEKGKAVGPINPLVDVYNAISLRYGLPCGVVDLDALVGDLRLTVTAGGDDFLALGDEHSEHTLPGEVCYVDDAGAVCRCWNWRDGQRTMLTEKTTNALAIFENLDPARHAALLEAMHALQAWAGKTVGGSISLKTVLTRESPEVALGQ